MTNASDEAHESSGGAASDRSLQPLIDALPVLVSELDRYYRIRFANAAHWRWFGLDPAAQIGRSIAEVVGDEAFAVLRPVLDQALAGDSATFCGEIPYARGGARFVHCTYLPRHDATGTIDGLYLLAIDLSEQQALRRRLATETLRARTVLDNAIDGIITIDEAGVIQSFNPAAERLFGYCESEAVGRNVSLIMADPDRSQHDGYLRRYLATGERRIIGIGREVTGRHRDGTLIDIELAVGELTEGGRRYFTGFTRDISDRKRAERAAYQRLEELARITRLHSMGELATGLAHEINQPLTAVHANAEACLAMLDQGQVDAQTLRGALNDIAEQSSRAGTIIEHLRGFLQTRQIEERSPECPNVLVEEVLTLLTNEIRAQRVQIERELAADAPCSNVDRVQIEQVIFNLLKNAVEAMATASEPRILGVRTGRQEPGWCEVTVSDTGPGIPEADLERLFDPFFTTKASGMGQGLAISRSLVEAHDGELLAENRPQGGVSFRLLLPAADAAEVGDG